jgi:hypothetical protein
MSYNDAPLIFYSFYTLLQKTVEFTLFLLTFNIGNKQDFNDGQTKL